MNWIYLSLVSTNEKGVGKKIDYQISSLKKQQQNVISGRIKQEKNKDYFFLSNKKIIRYYYKNNIFGKIINKICLFIILWKLRNKKYYKDVEVVYIRFFYTYSFVVSYYEFLKKLGIRIILEIPTYPYDGEIKKENIFTKMDKKYRLELYRYVDKIVTYSDDKEIWGVPCINISNGIDLESVKLIKRKEREANQIVFTIVSNCSFWHGIDRTLKSLSKYNTEKNKRKIIFNIVGEGNESSKLKKLVRENINLAESVIFQGFKKGEELEEIYNQTDVGIGSLGMHRIKGLTSVQPLKNREYTAKGIPFIISFNDPDFVDKKFVYKISNNEELFDFKKIIDWYEKLKITPEEIREYAKPFSWNIQMKKVIDKLGE